MNEEASSLGSSGDRDCLRVVFGLECGPRNPAFSGFHSPDDLEFPRAVLSILKYWNMEKLSRVKHFHRVYTVVARQFLATRLLAFAAQSEVWETFLAIQFPGMTGKYDRLCGS